MWLASGVIAVTAAIALVDLAEQYRIAASRDAALGSGPGVAAMLPVPSGAISPESQVLDALRAARSAAALPAGSQRSGLVDRAVTLASDGAAARPGWGRADVVLAYAASLGTRREDGQRARAALARSYADAPFLYDAARWRIRYAVEAWPALGPVTRRAALDEAVWLLGIDQDSWGAIFDTFRASRAYVPFMLRWREALSGPSSRSSARRLPEA